MIDQNKLPGFRLITVPLAFIAICIATTFLVAAEKKEARITQVVRDVRLLTSRAASRPAAINDDIRQGTAVKTGGDSRAELTFADQSLTRLGANTIFSFGPGGHDYDLTTGAILLCLPKGSGPARINSPSVTAAISGGIAMGESHQKSWIKFIVIEGQGVMTLKSTGEKLVVSAGQMVMLPPGAKKFTKVQNIDLKKLVDKSLLIHFARLPAWVWALIDAEIAKQQASPPRGGFFDPTGFDAIDQRAAAEPTPFEPKMRHPSPSPGERR